MRNSFCLACMGKKDVKHHAFWITPEHTYSKMGDAANLLI